MATDPATPGAAVDTATQLAAITRTLTGEAPEAQPVAKAEDVEKAENPFAKKDDEADTDAEDDKAKEGKVEKAEPAAADEPTGAESVETQVSKAIAPLLETVSALRAEVESLKAAQGEAFTSVAKGVEAGNDASLASATVLAELREGYRALTAKVEELGSQPAGRRGVVAKAEPMTESGIDETPMREYLKSESCGLDTVQRVAVTYGDHSLLPAEVQQAMGYKR